MKRGAMWACALLLSGCGGPPAGTDARSSALGFGNNTEVGNPMIVRFDGVLGQIIIAQDHFSVQATRSREMGCSTAQFYNYSQVQQVIQNPEDPLSEEIRQFSLAKDIFIAVYRGYFWDLPGAETRPNPEFCAEVNSRRLGTGIGNAVTTDNDLYAWLRDPQHVNAFGVMAQGTVEIDGETKRYSALERCVWNAPDASTVHCVDRINLSP